MLSVPWPFVKSRFHFNAFSFDKADIFTRFGLAFTLKRSNVALLEQLNWKRLDTQRQIQVATMVYKSIHGLAPDYLGSLFTKYNPPYNLRNSENKLAVPLPRTNFLKNSFSYNGAVLWNSLSPELRQAKSLKSFRNGCRDFFD